MKRTIVWLLALVMVTMVQAEEITSQQALQQAQRFLQERTHTAVKEDKIIFQVFKDSHMLIPSFKVVQVRLSQ